MNRTKLPEIFLKQDVFQHEFKIPVPVKTQREDILEALCSSIASIAASDKKTIKSTASRVALTSAGYVAKDLRNLCRSALLHSLRQNDGSIPLDHDVVSPTASLNTDTRGEGHQTGEDSVHDFHHIQRSLAWQDFAYALETSKPSQQVEFETLVRPRRGIRHGGYSTLKKRVHQAIHWPIFNPETFKRIGVKPPMGLLLYGPSGCGKTMLVQALAAESNMNFIPIKGPEIFSKYLGETEATLRRLFAMARQIAPCILFFDEMDSIGAKRGWGGDADSSGSNGVNERVLSTLLNEMDGVEERTGVFVIGCTNRPQAVDDALLRPGRLDQLIYVGYPGLQDRLEIIETIGERIPLPTDSEARCKLAKLTVGFSPADLDALFREAAILSLRRDIASQRVDLKDIEQVVHTMSPSVQARVNKSPQPDADDHDVIIPDQYRQFQQER
ncbi:P-loop containing nucleoside triphosphate hydrolase protein [Gamsiella multidivaricata]|uniref:P-loop containing nucleoside triphosphate hydrolase protein n=1 Tax=Gamsiella multidivaricata TaxID=101098 RepID=UPI002220BDE8|nr:P-loop containing nucleoside triphosphate hydrolase protein [Gamsiella multidivaricata]KAI7824648.1 P-loop containing nucleoside triphosphate hydrolase protein [Gamsiella multidivaricata]